MPLHNNVSPRPAMAIHLAIGLLVILFLWLPGCSSERHVLLPGPTSDGKTLLPNGWKLSPVGQHLPIGDLPLNMAISSDGRTCVVTNNGAGKQELTLIDLQQWKVMRSVPVSRSWLGITFTADDNEILVSGGNDNMVDRYALQGDALKALAPFNFTAPWPQGRAWVAGISVARDGTHAFAVTRESNRLYRLNLTSNAIEDSLTLPALPYTCLASRDGRHLYVSLWGGSSVLDVDPLSLTMRQRIPTEDHPCDMAESEDGRLFVPCANTNNVDVIDPNRGVVSEHLGASFLPDLPPGSTPNSVAVSPDGKYLVIASADNNSLSVFDIHVPGKSRSLGFIPTAWYPSCVRFEPRSGDILVTSAKGLQSLANPHGPQPSDHSRNDEYIGTLFKGVLTRIPFPTEQELAQLSRCVYENSPFSTPPDKTDSLSVIWSRPGLPCPIKHVFYIIKENRTYDQVFGDMPEGNGDPRLCIFPDSITPNIHALARQFVLLDNLYCDAEVSADGHNWSMGAYATDYTEKTWPTSYGGRGGEYEFEGGVPIVFPSQGYFWDNCARHAVSYRTYGEYCSNPAGPDKPAQPGVPCLAGHVAPQYTGWDLGYSDVDRVKDWDKEFTAYEQDGKLPQFQTIKLPNDHTEGTARGALTPRAFVAENDLAVGMLVERISHSKYWKESAIFIIEDDAQNGPDHVDAHRTEALVISPYTRHGYVDHAMYSTSSMVRTMEAILGLPPISQYSASARPMTRSFTGAADLAPYVHRDPHIDIMEHNAPNAYGQKESDSFDFSREDAVPDEALTRVIWHATTGTDAPAPVRAAFVKDSTPEDDD